MATKRTNGGGGGGRAGAAFAAALLAATGAAFSVGASPARARQEPAATPATASAAAPARVRDVVYGRKMGVALTLDVFRPARPNGIGVLWMVSGGWVSRHEAINPAIAKVFTDRGMTVFAVVHGSQPKFTLPEIVQDVHRAVRFVRANAGAYGVDPDRLGIGGASAGGHLSLMMAAYGAPGDPKAADPVDRASSAVQAVAAFFPPTDFLNYGKDAQRAADAPELRAFWHVFGVAPAMDAQQRDGVLRPLSPVYGLSAASPPTLLIHGDADKLVPIQQSERVMARLEEGKVPHDLVVRPGQQHGWPGMDRDFLLLADWFARHLGTPKPARPAAAAAGD